MIYDFSKITTIDDSSLIEEFIDKYTNYLNSESEEMSEVPALYKKIVHKFSSSFEESEMLELFEALATHELESHTPYIIITNELYCLKNLLLSKMIKEQPNLNITEFLKLFRSIDDKIASIYLLQYIEKLISLNNIRINSLADLMEKNIVKHYESHLTWLSELALSVKNQETNHFPSLDERVCEFGTWLHKEAKHIIQNNSKFTRISNTHKKLHLFAHKIHDLIGKNENNILLIYLEKCELLSLSIGTDLALIDNIIMNKRVTKDALTGALNRQGLRPVFESQYELSVATHNHFVLAMCDLDNFKQINDTYGHVAGDRVLKMFVDVVKKHLRNSDIIIRYGGEEFVILLPAITKEKGFVVIDAIRKSFEKSSLECEGKLMQTTVSIGMMEVTPKEHYRSSYLDEYINIVDQKLYSAKNGGKNKVEVC